MKWCAHRQCRVGWSFLRAREWMRWRELLRQKLSLEVLPRKLSWNGIEPKEVLRQKLRWDAKVLEDVLQIKLS